MLITEGRAGPWGQASQVFGVPSDGFVSQVSQVFGVPSDGFVGHPCMASNARPSRGRARPWGQGPPCGATLRAPGPRRPKGAKGPPLGDP